MIEHIIEGIPDENLRNQAWIQDFLNVNRLLRAFEKVFLPERVTSKNKDRLPVKNSESSKSSESSKNGETKSTRTNDRCYNCGKAGHIASKCRDEKRPAGSCFKCASLEHKIRDCPLLREKSTTVSEVAVVEIEREDEMFFPTVSLMLEDADSTFEVKVRALMDSGSPVSLIKLKCVGPNFIVNESEINGNYYGLNNSKLCAVGKIEAKCLLHGFERILNLLVVKDDTMSSPVVLGRDAFRAFGIVLPKPTKTPEPVLSVDDEFISTIMNIDVGRLSEVDKLSIGSDVDFGVKEALKSDFEKFYLKPERPEKPRTAIDLNLKLKKHEPFNFSPRRLAFSEKIELRKITDDLLERKIIRESDSDYSSRVVLVKKKNGKIRMCVDYRTLNKCLESSNFPLPLIEDQIELLRGEKYFSSLDLKDGFYHVESRRTRLSILLL